jgi:hypothetical protein
MHTSIDTMLMYNRDVADALRVAHIADEDTGRVEYIGEHIVNDARTGLIALADDFAHEKRDVDDFDFELVCGGIEESTPFHSLLILATVKRDNIDGYSV